MNPVENKVEVRERIYLSKPDVGPVEEEFVVRALHSGWVAPLGPEVDAFEDDVKQRCDREYAVALSSGTAALHLGLIALGVKRGDVVVTSSMTFAATANSITYVGAEPYFIDCDLVTGNMDPQLLDEAMEELIAEGKHIGAVVPVDLLGQVADFPAIEEVVAKRSEQAGYRIPILADAAESFGAALQTDAGIKPAGSFGDAAILSFNGNKIMTTSGGGILLTDDKALADKVRYLATQARQPVVHYEHTEVGYNYRMSNILAALGRAQVSRLDEMIGRRKQIRRDYKNLFAEVPGVTVLQSDEQNSDEQFDNCWLTSVVVDSSKTVGNWTAQDLSAALNALNIENRPLWKPMHLQPIFADNPAKTNGNGETLFQTGLTLPSGSGLTEEQRNVVFTAITEFLG
ncbi:DegT/DnrJ/EryC1/StrS family aminotransferase [Actinomyces minihominis]|uniref:DegT/DnrJ/EryC1/StrS family aminotransferase n=1 Tax=Actinomyces minihominis TaxID=2002838 RepID=UPI001F5DB48D|nr:aminotransferase class I/II-fold pyridoxal phosphate-dependent enzyme [Actinomyces minihominis]